MLSRVDNQKSERAILWQSDTYSTTGSVPSTKTSSPNGRTGGAHGASGCGVELATADPSFLLLNFFNKRVNPMATVKIDRSLRIDL